MKKSRRPWRHLCPRFHEVERRITGGRESGKSGDAGGVREKEGQEERRREKARRMNKDRASGKFVRLRKLAEEKQAKQASLRFSLIRVRRVILDGLLLDLSTRLRAARARSKKQKISHSTEYFLLHFLVPHLCLNSVVSFFGFSWKFIILVCLSDFQFCQNRVPLGVRGVSSGTVTLFTMTSLRCLKKWSQDELGNLIC